MYVRRAYSLNSLVCRHSVRFPLLANRRVHPSRTRRLRSATEIRPTDKDLRATWRSHLNVGKTMLLIIDRSDLTDSAAPF